MLCVSRRSSLKEWSKSDRAALGPEQAEPCQWVGLFEVSCRACNTKSRSERPVTPNLSPELNTPSASFSSRFVSTRRDHSSESVPSVIMKSTRSSCPLMTRSSVASPPRFLMPESWGPPVHPHPETLHHRIAPMPVFHLAAVRVNPGEVFNANFFVVFARVKPVITKQRILLAKRRKL